VSEINKEQELSTEATATEATAPAAAAPVEAGEREQRRAASPTELAWRGEGALHWLALIPDAS